MLCAALLFTREAKSSEAESQQQQPTNSVALKSPYVYHTVNVITGEYCENETDLNLTGPVSFSLKRSYSSQDPFSQGWYFNSPNFLFISDEMPKQGENNKIHYDFDEKNRIKTITLNSPKEKVIHHRLNFQYKEDDFTECEVSSDDGQAVHYTFRKVEPSQTIHPYLLDKVINSNGSHITYSYVDHPYERKKVISRREEPEGRYLEMEYYDSSETVEDPLRDPRIGRVKLQKAPVGHDNTPIVTSRFFYEPNETTVYNALNIKTIYRYGSHNKLTSIENFLEGDLLYRIERFHWNKKEQLAGRSIEDASGKVYNCRTFHYDKLGNLLKETLYGNLTGTKNLSISLGDDGLPVNNGIESRSTISKYSDDERHLLVYQADEKRRSRNSRYQYRPDSDLIDSIFTYNHGLLKVRQFYRYDDFNRLIEIIIDDGMSEDPGNLKGVTERKITYLTLRSEAPGLGMPKIIDEKYLDLSTGNEELIKRTLLTYSQKNEVIQKDIYDALGELQHSYTHTYDAKGNLIRTTDTKGHFKEVSYDAHGNELLIDTNDSRSTNAYDYSNRLIHSEEERL